MPRVFENVPLKDPVSGRDWLLRGEAIITYSDFERINESNRGRGCEIQESEKLYAAVRYAS